MRMYQRKFHKLSFYNLRGGVILGTELSESFMLYQEFPDLTLTHWTGTALKTLSKENVATCLKKQTKGTPSFGFKMEIRTKTAL